MEALMDAHAFPLVYRTTAMMTTVANSRVAKVTTAAKTRMARKVKEANPEV
jgi:hypothetical protein